MQSPETKESLPHDLYHPYPIPSSSFWKPKHKKGYFQVLPASDWLALFQRMRLGENCQAVYFSPLTLSGLPLPPFHSPSLTPSPLLSMYKHMLHTHWFCLIIGYYVSKTRFSYVYSSRKHKLQPLTDRRDTQRCSRVVEKEKPFPRPAWTQHPPQLLTVPTNSELVRAHCSEVLWNLISSLSSLIPSCVFSRGQQLVVKILIF